jgi:hypothetical protein
MRINFRHERPETRPGASRSASDDVRREEGYSWIRTPFERIHLLRRTTSQAKTAERTRPTPVVAPSAS